MTWLVLSLAASTFALGFGAGYITRELSDPRQEGRSMRLPRIPRVEWLERLLIVISLLVNAVLGFALIGQRAATERGDADRDALVACIRHYNQDLGEALNERDDRNRASTAASRLLWQQLRANLAQPRADQTALLASIDEYLRSLRAVQEARVANPYPNPAVCTERPR